MSIKVVERSPNGALDIGPVTVNYTGTNTKVFEIDILEYMDEVFSDWEAYIYIEELSGNAINYTLKSTVCDIEVQEMSGNIDANGSTRLTISVPVEYRLYIKSADGTSTGQIKVAIRIVPYRSL